MGERALTAAARAYHLGTTRRLTQPPTLSGTGSEQLVIKRSASPSSPRLLYYTVDVRAEASAR